MEQAFQAFDWSRMVFGSEPPLFLLEILVRTLIVYAYALGLLRWLGSRTIGQLSTVEFLLVIALGSAVGDAMFYPEVPLIHALLVVTIVVLANKGLDMLIARSSKAEAAIDGVPEEAVRDGVFCRSFLKSTTMGTSEMRQELRERGIEHLGQVSRAYVEADGAVTVFCARDASRPGLPIVPPWEIESPQKVKAGSPADEKTVLACMLCGLTTAPRKTAPAECEHCGHTEWTPARQNLLYGDATTR